MHPLALSAAAGFSIWKSPQKARELLDLSLSPDRNVEIECVSQDILIILAVAAVAAFGFAARRDPRPLAQADVASHGCRMLSEQPSREGCLFGSYPMQAAEPLDSIARWIGNALLPTSSKAVR
jgi:hypothetical protein